MNENSKLITIKVLHTAIWLFFNAVMIYLFYSVFTNRIDKWVWIGLGSFFVEGTVLLLFKKVCPLTILARRYSGSPNDNFDIYLPNWLAKNTKLIYTTLLFIVIILLIMRLSFGN
jgi:hypothetical protein